MGEMKVLLINPNFRGSKVIYDVNVRLRQPLDLAYLSSILDMKEIENEILDANILDLSENEILERINQFSPSHIILTTSPLDRWECPQVDLHMVFSLIGKISPAIKLIVYGTHGSVSPEWVREKSARPIEYIIKGEPEKHVSDLFGGKPIRHEYNVYQNLDDLPMPNFQKLPMELYGYNGEELKKPFSILLSSRGCPYQCSFCLREMFKNYRAHSPERVLEEIKYLKENYSVNSIFFQDWEFLLDKERARKICQLLKKNGIYVNFGINARAQDLNYEIIRALQEVGLQRINIGLESASNKVLKAIRKGITKDDLLGAVRLSKETGVKFAYCGIYNLPSEDFSTIKETEKFIADNNIDFMPGVARPYPGTELARLGENINWQNMESKAGRLGTKISPAIAILLYKFFIHYYRDGLFFMFKRKNFGKNLIFIKRLLKRCILQWDLS